ncbi:MAG TPA: biotin/lipoyl-binding protein [Phycisphaerales bacterium]|nr:biotin/lipoyl-binding protein [Phycisphaerales bacterium]
MILKYLLPLVAALGVAFAVYTVLAQSKPQPQAAPVAQPATSPYQSQVPGAGLVEPSTEFISIGTNVPGIVTKVFVKAGDKVKAGDPLFMIDDRSLKADLASREAVVSAAQAAIDRLRAMPRREEIPPAEAKLREAQTDLEDLSAQLSMWEQASTVQGTVSADTLSQKRFAVAAAQTRVAQARSALDLLKAGAWAPDIAIAEANLAEAKADVQKTRTAIDLLTVNAPVAAEILKVNVRAGQYAPVSSQGTGGSGGSGSAPDPDSALMIIGDTDVLHIRVDIDENDAWRVKEGTKGTAFIRGNSKLHTPIKFVRFEPYVIPKKSLTGASGERVDTRVLQVICSFRRSDLNAPVYVGQQMDVFLEGPPLGDATFGADPAQGARDAGGQ